MKNALKTTVTTLVSRFAPAKTTAKFEDRVRDLIAAGSAEVDAAHTKADALTELATEITVTASRSRSYARRLSGLVGKLDAAVE